MRSPHPARPGRARLLVDGKLPAELPELYAAARPSDTWCTDWPAVSRIGWVKPLRLEQWRLRITASDEALARFRIGVSGSLRPDFEVRWPKGISRPFGRYGPAARRCGEGNPSSSYAPVKTWSRSITSKASSRSKTASLETKPVAPQARAVAA